MKPRRCQIALSAIGRRFARVSEPAPAPAPAETYSAHCAEFPLAVSSPCREPAPPADVPPAGGAPLQSGEAASRLAHNQEIAGASPASATISPETAPTPTPSLSAPTSPQGGGLAPALRSLDLTDPLISDRARTLLGLVAAHDRVSPQKFLTQAICDRAEAIGLSGLLDNSDSAARGRENHANTEGADLRGRP